MRVSMAINQHLEQPASRDNGASKQIDAHRLQDTLAQTWGRDAGSLPSRNDTAAPHLATVRLAENGPPAGTATDVASNQNVARATDKSKPADKAELSPISSALISQAEKAHNGEFSYAPHQGSRYGVRDVPPELRCAAAMSQVMINAHKDIGSPLNYNKFYEVGVDKWKNLYQGAGLVSPVRGQPQSGDFIVATDSPKTPHPHIGLLSNENGVMTVYHNQSGSMVKEPLSQSRDFNSYRHKEYLRPR
jgi:hypothetical protein